MGWNYPTHFNRATGKTSEPNNLVLHQKTVNTYHLKYTEFKENRV